MEMVYPKSSCSLPSDIDVTQNLGTQEIFYTRRNPVYISLHGLPDYPYYWGLESEKGEGEGLNYNINIPLPHGTQDPEYLNALSMAVATYINRESTDVIVVSLGVDTFVDDPVGGFFLTKAVYNKIGIILAEIKKPTLFVMEGGYNMEHIGTNVVSLLDGFESVN